MGLGCGHRLWACGLWAYGLWAWAVGRYRGMEKKAYTLAKMVGKIAVVYNRVVCRRKNWNFLKISGFDFESAIFL